MTDATPTFDDIPEEPLDDPSWVPECGAPDPPGLRDPLASVLIDGLRSLLHYILFHWDPARLASWPGIWQWDKFKLLDWLRPVEQVVRRFLLIEAFHLALSQQLPSARVSLRPKRARVRVQPPLDPDRPQDWPAHFKVFPKADHRKRRSCSRRLPYPFDHFRGDPRVPLRYRRVLHNPWPLAIRLQAAIRIVRDPMPHIRRLAFRLRRIAAESFIPLMMPPRMRVRLAVDALADSSERVAALLRAYRSSA